LCLNSLAASLRQQPRRGRPQMTFDIPVIPKGRPTIANSHALLCKDDNQRLELLDLSRTLTPVGTIVRIDKIPRSVLPKLLAQPTQWFILAVYITAAVLQRNGVDFGPIDGVNFEGAGQMVTFMIIFYVGYCYNRQQVYFDEAQQIMTSIQNACVLARTLFRDQEDVIRLWRHLNLFHVAAYTGLADIYNEFNFFEPLVKKYKLFGEPGSLQHDYERECFANFDLDNDWTKAADLCEVWAVQNINAQFKKGGFSPPVHSSFNKCVFDIGDSMKKIFAANFQVLPFIYTHMVSLSCTVYLTGSAFLRGLEFTPESGITGGFLMPFVYVVLTNLTIYGLLVVGDTVFNPFGEDPEDFAVVRFIEHTAKVSLEAIECPGYLPSQKYLDEWKKKHPDADAAGVEAGTAEA